MTLQHISPADAKALIDKGAVLVDVREARERRAKHIPGSQNMPLSQLGPLGEDAKDAEAVIFFCRSGMRTAANAAALARAADCKAYVLDGGIEGWSRAGLPTEPEPRVPLTPEQQQALQDSILRQTQVVVGLAVLIGAWLAYASSPAWLALPVVLGLALLIAGATGWNGLAGLVAALPWNRDA